MGSHWTDEQIVDAFAEYVNSGKVDMYRQIGLAVIPGDREGVTIQSRDGSQSLLNCRSSGGVFNLGHRPPEIVEAVHDALDRLDIGDHLLLSEQRAKLAKRLAGLMPEGITYTTFGVSGGEAVDFALKLARGYTGRTDVISVRGGYHGHTGLALAAGDRSYRAPFGPALPGFRQVPFGDADALAEEVNDETAAVIVETIPATSGILIPPNGYFQKTREICTKHGALLVIDEVQAGLGRTGRLWAIDEWNVAPDIMVLGKGLSAAIYPITATCYTSEIDQWLAETDPFIHVSTFGGSDIGCVAALTMLDIVSEPSFLSHVEERGQYLMDGFRDLQTRYPSLVREVRGRGLMIGVETASQQMGMMLTPLLVEHGVLALYANNNPATMIVMPPLIIKKSECDSVLQAFENSFKALESRL